MGTSVRLERKEYNHAHAHKYKLAQKRRKINRMRTNVICDVQRSATTRTSRTTCPRRRRSARPALRRTATSRTNLRRVHRVKGTVPIEQKYVKKTKLFYCGWN